ncbi:DUF5132 domain-containing protein [Streptomyces sp. MST-110588]|uniref:DUF5132 domain-containing protein n=1 Tax=Streptomyces sp. MST-110588 TaxID=2833628 RepID=UPI002052702A|nr:DUF5132 domain-containing protein [Streptomyces sp. MST-110588]UNO43340.1 DUF5132 domain-containing protein [Streptomyces sp. MST-110588]
MAAFPPFLAGLLVIPVAKRVVKPLARGVVKTSLKLAMDAKKAVHEASEELHDLAAEVSAEAFIEEAADTTNKDDRKAAPKQRSAPAKAH